MRILYQKPLLYGDISTPIIIFAVVIAFVIALLIALFITALFIEISGNASMIYIVIFSVLSIIASIVEYNLVRILKEPTEYNRYEVILDDDYLVKELYDNYRVIEQRGEIWVIEDRR